MKKSIFYTIMMLFALNFIPANAMTITGAPVTPTTENTKEVPAEVTRMMNRLEEIKAMDKSDMSRSEKRALRKEVKAIRANMAKSNGGVYLSVGAIIIIILLLILLL